MKFRKKPVVIHARPWFKDGDHPDVRDYRRTNDDHRKLCKKCSNRIHSHGWVSTLEGGHIVCPGDWIITGVQGEVYPCKPDIFEQTYEPVEA